MTSLRQRASFRLHSTGSMSTLESSGKILVMKKAEGEKGREGFGRVAYRRVHSTFVGKNVSSGEKLEGVCWTRTQQNHPILNARLAISKTLLILFHNLCSVYDKKYVKVWNFFITTTTGQLKSSSVLQEFLTSHLITEVLDCTCISGVTTFLDCFRNLTLANRLIRCKTKPIATSSLTFPRACLLVFALGSHWLLLISILLIYVCSDWLLQGLWFEFCEHERKAPWGWLIWSTRL